MHTSNFLGKEPQNQLRGESVAIETTLTLGAFLAIIALSLMIRIAIMVPYRLIRRYAGPHRPVSSWPRESRTRLAFRNAGSSVPRFFTEKVGPLAVFLIASIARAVGLVLKGIGSSTALLAGSFVDGVVAIGRTSKSTVQRSIPWLDRMGDSILDSMAAAMHIPYEAYSPMSPSAIYEGALWREIAEDHAGLGSSPGFMDATRKVRPHPALQTMLMDRRQAV